MTGSRGTVNFDTVVVSGSQGMGLNLVNGAPASLASLVTKLGAGNVGW